MTKNINMDNNKRKFNLEERSTKFAINIILLCKKVPKNSITNRLISQVVGSSGSVGANYREANDALGKKDFIHRIKIARKEAKETIHWLQLIDTAQPEFEQEIEILKQEAIELRNILSAIIKKVEDK